MRKKNNSLKKAALEGAKKAIAEQPLLIDEYEALLTILESDNLKIKSLINQSTREELFKLRLEAREKRPCREILRILAKLSKKILNEKPDKGE